MTVLVRYLYPVFAEVDLEEGAVVRVVVDDEASAAPAEVLDLASDVVTADVASRALAIVEADTWPSWEFGW